MARLRRQVGHQHLGRLHRIGRRNRQQQAALASVDVDAVVACIDVALGGLESRKRPEENVEQVPVEEIDDADDDADESDHISQRP